MINKVKNDAPDAFKGANKKSTTDIFEELTKEDSGYFEKNVEKAYDPDAPKKYAIESQSLKIGPAPANSRQPGGGHYIKYGDLQVWDVVARWNLDFFQGNILKYVVRWKDKNGTEDLEKAMHYLQKYIEVERDRAIMELVQDVKEEFNKIVDEKSPYTGK